MKDITYTLLNGENNSDNFYSVCSDFTDEILTYSRKSVLPEINKFRKFLSEGNKEKLRTKEEYIFEFLMIGVFWITYSGRAVNLHKMPRQLLSLFVDLRQKHKSVKKYIDLLRGLLGTYFLYSGFKSKTPLARPAVKNFNLLIGWLIASGEFKEEVKRLNQWLNYLEYAGDADAIINEAIKFAQWFETESIPVLGKYTEGVNYYLKYKIEEHYWKEDIIFCARSRVEYHLNMVGAEIMNRAFNGNFNKAPNRAVLIPACMRALPDEVCKAERIGQDYICTNCTSYCRVHQLNMLGRRENFKVYIIPHSSDFSDWLKEHGVNSGVGTVGVACINNLISGGLELKALDIPAQCILLDYCGCKSHWDKKGFPTDINICRLKTIMRQASSLTTPGHAGNLSLTTPGTAGNLSEAIPGQRVMN